LKIVSRSLKTGQIVRKREQKNSKGLINRIFSEKVENFQRFLECSRSFGTIFSEDSSISKILGNFQEFHEIQEFL
jgi:hypothetical protein